MISGVANHNRLWPRVLIFDYSDTLLAMHNEEVHNKLTGWFAAETRLALTTVFPALEIVGVVTISGADGESLELRSIGAGIVFVLRSGEKLRFFLAGDILTNRCCRRLTSANHFDSFRCEVSDGRRLLRACVKFACSLLSVTSKPMSLESARAATLKSPFTSPRP